MKIKLQAESYIAETSNDHLCPTGCVNDNFTNYDLIYKIKKLSNNKLIKILDLGCAGGQFVIDLMAQGNLSVGLEGSSHALNGSGKHNWSEYKDTNLFLCDVVEPFSLYTEDSKKIYFDMIHSSELIEHLQPYDLWKFFNNVKNNLASNGIFCCQISLQPDIRTLGEKMFTLHNSVYPTSIWKKIIKDNGFLPCDNGKNDDNHIGYLFDAIKFRDHGQSSVYCCLKVK